jgi:mRNA interferase HigB
MRIIAKATLREFWERHPPAAVPLRKWFSLVAVAEWRGPADVKAMFGTSVDFVADNRIIFDVAGNKYRLIVRVSYEYGQVLIKFVGTHADYDKIDARSV